MSNPQIKSFRPTTHPTSHPTAHPTSHPTAAQNEFWQMIGLPPRGNPLFKALNDGLPYEVYNKLADQSGIDKKNIAQAAVIPPATLARRAKTGSFTKDESDRLYRFAQMLKATIDLFEGDVEQAAKWLNQPVRGLGGRVPLSMLRTSAESTAVMDLIGRLEHGIVS